MEFPNTPTAAVETVKELRSLNETMSNVHKLLAQMHGTLVKIEANTKPRPNLAHTKSSYR